MRTIEIEVNNRYSLHSTNTAYTLEITDPRKIRDSQSENTQAHFG